MTYPVWARLSTEAGRPLPCVSISFGKQGRVGLRHVVLGPETEGLNLSGCVRLDRPMHRIFI